MIHILFEHSVFYIRPISSPAPYQERSIAKGNNVFSYTSVLCVVKLSTQELRNRIQEPCSRFLLECIRYQN